jgi:predicted aspartyl protease
MAEEKALVDSGATENFMDERMVQQLGIGQREMKTPH